MKVLKEKTQTRYRWRHIHLNRSRIMIFSVLMVLAFMLFVMDRFPYASIGVVFIPLSYGLGIYTYRKLLVWQSGEVGEEIVTEELRKLDDRYLMINSVVIPPNRGDTDHILVGPNGIFVIETKNLSGVVKCIGDKWWRFKVGRGGGTYSIPMGSPSNQVKRNAKVLKDFILEHGREVFKREAPHLWVDGIVVFSAGNVELDIKDPSVNVLEPGQLVEHVNSAKTSSSLSKIEIERLGRVILKYCD